MHGHCMPIVGFGRLTFVWALILSAQTYQSATAQSHTQTSPASLQLAALGQTATAQPPAAAVQPRRSSNWKHNPEYDGVELKKMPNLPFLPEYTGKLLFIEGQYLPHLRRGSCYQVLYEAREEPAVVLDWYRSALQQYGWTLEKGQRNEAVAARRDKEGLVCFIGMRGGPLKEGYHCKFMVRFMEVPPLTPQQDSQPPSQTPQ